MYTIYFFINGINNIIYNILKMSDDSKGEDDIASNNKQRFSHEKRKSFLSFLTFNDKWENSGNKVTSLH
jgi:hypothetical protein